MPGVEHAVVLAEAFDVETDCNLRTERTQDRWAVAGSGDADVWEQLAAVRDQFGGVGGSDDAPGGDHDTVGAVAGGREPQSVATRVLRSFGAAVTRDDGSTSGRQWAKALAATPERRV